MKKYRFDITRYNTVTNLNTVIDRMEISIYAYYKKTNSYLYGGHITIDTKEFKELKKAINNYKM